MKNFRLKQLANNLQLGKAGNRLKKSSTFLALQNAADSGLVVGRVDDATEPDDLMNRQTVLNTLGTKGVVYVGNTALVDVQTLPSTIPVGNSYLYDKSIPHQLFNTLRIAPANGHKIIFQGNVIEGTGAATEGPNLVTNGTFNTDLSGWIVDGTSWVSGRAFQAINLNRRLEQAITTVVGKRYILTCDFENTVNAVSPSPSGAGIFAYTGLNATGTSLGFSYSRSVTSGKLILSFVAQTTTTYIFLTKDDNADEVYFDNVEVRLAGTGYIEVQGSRKSFALMGLDSTTWGLYSDITPSEHWGLIGRDTWVSKAVLITGKYHAASKSLAGYGYSISGILNTSSRTNENNQYNDSSNLWISKSVDLSTRHTPAMFSLDGYLYNSCGFDGSIIGTTTQYNHLLDSWSSKAVNPTARYGVMGMELSGTGFIVGGHLSAVCTSYNTVSNTWSAVTSLPSPRFRCGLSVINGFGYITGGDTSDTGTGTSTLNTQYNNLSGAWISKSSINPCGYSGSGFSSNGYVYNVCGLSSGVSSAQTSQYLDINDRWVSKSLNSTARYSNADFGLNGYNYSTGGISGSTVYNTNTQYN